MSAPWMAQPVYPAYQAPGYPPPAAAPAPAPGYPSEQYQSYPQGPFQPHVDQYNLPPSNQHDHYAPQQVPPSMGAPPMRPGYYPPPQHHGMPPPRELITPYSLAPQHGPSPHHGMPPLDDMGYPPNLPPYPSQPHPAQRGRGRGSGPPSRGPTHFTRDSGPGGRGPMHEGYRDAGRGRGGGGSRGGRGGHRPAAAERPPPDLSKGFADTESKVKYDELPARSPAFLNPTAAEAAAATGTAGAAALDSKATTDLCPGRARLPIVLFDLNGTLTSHTAQRNSSGVTKVRPGIAALAETLSGICRVGIYSSATHRTVATARALVEAECGGTPLFEPGLILHRDHTKPAGAEHVKAGGKTWDTQKPLYPWFKHVHRVILVDDDQFKAVKSEKDNLLLVPCWEDTDQDCCVLAKLADALKKELATIGPDGDVRPAAAAVAALFKDEVAEKQKRLVAHSDDEAVGEPAGKKEAVGEPASKKARVGNHAADGGEANSASGPDSIQKLAAMIRQHPNSSDALTAAIQAVRSTPQQKGIHRTLALLAAEPSSAAAAASQAPGDMDTDDSTASAAARAAAIYEAATNIAKRAAQIATEVPCMARVAKAAQAAATAAAEAAVAPELAPADYLEQFPKCQKLMNYIKTKPGHVCKTPASVLQEFAAQRVLTVIWDESGVNTLGPFTVTCKLAHRVTGEELEQQGSGTARTKKDARQVAAAHALEQLLPEDIPFQQLFSTDGRLQIGIIVPGGAPAAPKRQSKLLQFWLQNKKNDNKKRQQWRSVEQQFVDQGQHAPGMQATSQDMYTGPAEQAAYSAAMQGVHYDTNAAQYFPAAEQAAQQALYGGYAGYHIGADGDANGTTTVHIFRQGSEYEQATPAGAPTSQ